MNIRTQIIVAVIVLAAFAYLIGKIRKNKLELKYALSWIVMGALILLLDFFPGIIAKLAEICGIGMPINMIFFLGFCFLLALTFTLKIIRFILKILGLVSRIVIFYVSLSVVFQVTMAA